MAVKLSGGVSPNILIVGAVSGFALYLLWKWTEGDGDGGGVVVWYEKQVEKQQEKAAELPFTPFWWWDKIAGAYSDIGGGGAKNSGGASGNW